MPKVFVMKTIIYIVFLPIILVSQEICIEQLPEEINTNNAELNFIQRNDSIAYFTLVSEIKGRLESNIYMTKFINGNWGKKKYAKYNSEEFNTGNICFSERGRIFFTVCKDEMRECKIVYLEENARNKINTIPIISSDKLLTTQPFIVRHGSQEVLYFVSDREGGFGGLDIWLSIIDNNGNFGAPINAGSKINSVDDEITPFYNTEDKMMYFSSNKKEGIGGFDIYRSAGSLNLWRRSKNIEELNTNQDEMYLTFYNKNKGYFASNRQGERFDSTEYCCNDIFSFNYTAIETDSIKLDLEIQLYSETHQYLPLDLYFHNDEPDCCTMRTITNKTYKDAYISYFMMQGEYAIQNSISNKFFEKVLKKNFNNLNKVLELLFFDLSKGNKMELQIKGYASPLHSPRYNQNLSQRRISSVINYLKEFKNGILKEYISSGYLVITELPFGESNSSEKVSDDANDKKKSIYSIEAMLERKIAIVDVILKQ